ncbi:MAG: FAD-dependent oxidoreductase, partial [FCB group bacterium]|nr:FAD-dependent oxidoreductase [FCB group bacterium]
MSDALKFQNGRPVFAISTGTMDWNHTGSWRYMRPRYEEKLPPCTAGCPTHERIPQYFALVKQENYQAAWEIILEDNPLPGVCGRVCYHPCEGVCNRSEFDTEISINAMERFVADQNLDHGYPDHFYTPTNGKQIAIIGSGPAGLSAAYQLGRRGYGVTIFEAAPEPGGMLRLGIPEYRLPRAILDKEITDIRSLGVTIETGRRLGDNLSLDDLTSRFEAVILALGAYQGRELDIPGRNLPGVSSALDFLQEFNLTGKSDLPPQVMVVGGGNTAVDAARSARRLGSDVQLVYRRSRDEMPAVTEEVDAALEEGVQLRTLTNPVAFLGADGVTEVQVIRMELGETDDSGRRRPIPVPGSEEILPATRVLLAIGETPQLENLPNIADTEGGRIVVDSAQTTSREKIFACGDVATG